MKPILQSKSGYFAKAGNPELRGRNNTADLLALTVFDPLIF